MSAAVDERRRRIMRAVIAVADAPIMGAGRSGVIAFHVRFFGVPECVTDLSLPTITRHLAWLEQQGYLEPLDGPMRRTEYVPTDKGRAWAG